MTCVRGQDCYKEQENVRLERQRQVREAIERSGGSLNVHLKEEQNTAFVQAEITDTSIALEPIVEDAVEETVAPVLSEETDTDVAGEEVLEALTGGLTEPEAVSEPEKEEETPAPVKKVAAKKKAATKKAAAKASTT